MAYLEEYELHAKKKFGQNFIIDPSVVRKIASLSHGGDTVIEIGPGLGALTQQLSFMYKNVVAYEIDPHMVTVLEKSLADADNVEIILGDFMKADLSRFVGEKISVCANLPYYITTPILFKLMTLDVNGMTLMVQKEIGERLAAKPNTKDYNALSIQIQYYYDVKTVMSVSRESFHPRPGVESIVVNLTPRDAKMPYNEAEFFVFVKACFQFRRKTLINNLKTLEIEIDYETIFRKCGLDERVRADVLSYDDYIKLYGEIYA